MTLFKAGIFRVGGRLPHALYFAVLLGGNSYIIYMVYFFGSDLLQLASKLLNLYPIQLSISAIIYVTHIPPV